MDINIDEIISDFLGLSEDEKQAELDALVRILSGKAGKPEGFSKSTESSDVVKTRNPALDDPEDDLDLDVNDEIDDSEETDTDKDKDLPTEDEVDDTSGTEFDHTVYDDPSKADTDIREIMRRKITAAKTQAAVQKALEKIKEARKALMDKKESLLTEAPIDLSKLSEEELLELEKKLTEADAKLAEILDNPGDSIDTLSNEAFDDLINGALSEVDKALQVNYVDDKDLEVRIQKIADLENNEVFADILDQEDRANYKADPEVRKIKAREEEKARYERDLAAAQSVKLGSLEEFKQNLEHAVRSQIEEEQDREREETIVRTYSRFDRLYEPEDIVYPGTMKDIRPLENPPIIDVYFDQSGSWSNYDVNKGMAAIRELFKLQNEGLLKLNIWYFSDILTQNREAARSQGSTECWDWIIDNINAPPKSKNVIMITDSDIGHDWGKPGHHGCIRGPGTTVDGVVWFLWKDSSRVPEAAAKLRGKEGTFQYRF